MSTDELIEVSTEGGDRLEVRYVPLETAGRWAWAANPKPHDLESLAESIAARGFKDPPKFEPELNGGQGGTVEGNGRVQALELMRAAGAEPPAGIETDADGGWLVPYLFGVNSATEGDAQAYGIDHNALPLLGAGLNPASIYRPGELAQVLGSMAEIPTAFSAADVTAAAAQKKAAPALADYPVRPGELWKAGPHRLFCADATQLGNLRTCLGRGTKANLVFTKPPTRGDALASVPLVLELLPKVLAAGGISYFCAGAASSMAPLAIRAACPTEGGVVLDPFARRGATLTAAHLEGAACYALDVEPGNLATALRRLAKLGLTPKNLGAKKVATK